MSKLFSDARVIVIGSDHQNTLGIIRACGMYGCRIDLIVHMSDKQRAPRCNKSRFLNGTTTIVSQNENELVTALTEKAEKEKAVVLPTSDFAALCIDKHFDQLSKYFYLPSIADAEGAIARHMDKLYQNELLREAGFQVAKTEALDLRADRFEERLEGWDYPVVLKPVVSAFGIKSDIVVSNSKNETIEHIRALREKGYRDILIQEYLNKDYELVCFGAVTKNAHTLAYGTLKKIRYYPYSGGASLSYAKYVDAEEYVLPILNFLKKLEYNGLFDIELFYMKGQIYINEINFRNSGNTWAIVKRGVNAPMIWVADILGRYFADRARTVPANGAFMNETSDLHYVIDRKIRVFSWLKDLFDVKAFNKFWIKDLPGSLAWYFAPKRNQ